jgi:hypothetical protein
MSVEKNPRDSASEPSDWTENFKRILRASEAMRKQHEAMSTLAKQMSTSASFIQAAADLEASRRPIDLSGYQTAMRWFTRNQKTMDSITEMLQRSYPLIEVRLRDLGATHQAPSAEPQAAVPIEETLAAFEAARADAGEESASQLEKLLEDDADIEADVTGLASLTNIQDPAVQRRVKKVIRWLLSLAVIALIVGDAALAGAISSLLSLFGVSLKDSDKAVDAALRKIIEKREADDDEDQEEA